MSPLQDSLPKSFDCLLVEATDTGVQVKRQQLPSDTLPEGEVTIRVAYSSLNYKDSMACQGHKGIIRKLPHIPGIDAAGSVVASSSESWKIGDKVIVTGNDLGQGHWGGWSEYIRVPAKWIVGLPEGLSLRESMILGTAGFTAAQCVAALQRNEVVPDSGRIVVTGASGGVGSLAVRLLAHLGYEVVAVSGKSEMHQELLRVGASQVFSRQEFASFGSEKPMLSAQWRGAVDTVGGNVLSQILRSLQFGGCVATCGLVAGSELDMTLYPFLLRGVTLCGIASADCPYAQRQQIWNLLSSSWKPVNLDRMVLEVPLADLPNEIPRIARGEIAGRVLVRVDQ